MEVCCLCGADFGLKSPSLDRHTSRRILNTSPSQDNSKSRLQKEPVVSESSNQRISLLDIAEGGTSFNGILEQILEEEEKGLIVLLNSGDICKECSDVLMSIDIYLQKLRELKWEIIQKFNLRIYREELQEQPNKEQQHNLMQQQQQNHQQQQQQHQQQYNRKPEKKRKSNKDADEDVLYEISYIRDENEPLPSPPNQSEKQPGLGVHHFWDSQRTLPDGEPSSPTTLPDVEPSSPTRQTDIIHDTVLEETKRTMLTVLSVDIDEETLDTLFNRQDNMLAATWRESLLPIVQEHVRFCLLQLLPTDPPDPNVMEFTGFCENASCSRSLRVALHTGDRRLDLEFSGGECRDSVTKVCDYCLKEFVGDTAQHQVEIRDHLTTHHSRVEDRIYSCRCGRFFNKKGPRNLHFKRCESNPRSDEQVTCEYCGKVVRNLARLNLHLNYCRRDVTCELCNKVCANGRKLEEHKFTVHDLQSLHSRVRREYPCDECGKVFNKKYNLDSHKLMHSDDKPFHCKVEDCGKSFKREITLKHHVEKVHENKVNPIYCDFCPAQIKSAAGLRVHVFTQHQVGTPIPKRFQCIHCDKGFKCMADLQVHSVTHTKLKAFSCTLCDQKFTRKNSLVEHMNVHAHKFRCDKCYKCFGRERYLKGHIENCLKSAPRAKEVESNTIETIFEAQRFSNTVIIKKDDILGFGPENPTLVVTKPDLDLT